VSTAHYYEENVSRPEKEGAARVFADQAENLIEYYECRGTRLNLRQLLSTVTDVSTGRGGNPDLSPRRLLSNEQRINAKTVTSLLIIPSVLGVRPVINS
jgi:hypothetical protein